MVLPISTASAPISIASAISPIMSPACVPTMPPPKIFPWQWASGESSNSSLVTPSSRPLATDRATGGCPWKQAFLDFDAFGFGFVFGQANPGHFRVCVGDAWDHAGVERCGSQLFGHTRIVAQTEFLLIVPRQLGIALAQQENVKVLEPPMLLPSYKVKQHWHERYNQDAGNV